MATLQEAQQSLTEAEQNILEQRKKIKEYREGAQKIETPSRTIAFQLENAKTGKYQQGRIEQTISMQRSRKQKALAEAAKAEEEINSFEQNILNPYRQQISSAEAQQRAYEQEQENYNIAKSWWNAGRRQIKELPEGARKYGRQFIQGDVGPLEAFQAKYPELSNQGFSPIFSNKDVVGLQDVKNQTSVPFTSFGSYLNTARTDAIAPLASSGVLSVENSPAVSVDVINSSGNVLSVEPKSVMIQEDFKTTRPSKYTGYQGVVSLPDKPKDAIEGWGGQLAKQSSQKDSFLVGGSLSVFGNVQSLQGLLTKPVDTVKQMGYGLYDVGKRFISGEGFPEVSRAIYDRPKETTGFVVTEIITGKGLGAVASKTKLLGSRVVTKLDPRYSEFTSQGIKLDTSTIKAAGSLKDISTPLEKQSLLSGTRVNAVSAQRDLFGMFTDKKTIRKPIPNEEKLTTSTRNMLTEFDKGNLDLIQTLKLNNQVIKETGSKGLLERSFFADPYGRVRISRLGVLEDAQKEASFLDILSGDVTTKANKPQIITFENTLIEDLPNNLKSKLSKGKSLNLKEQAQLLDFQNTKSGKFKPIGFLSKEPEITHAPGEIIVKDRTAAVSLVNGRRVEILKASVKQASEKVSDLLGKKDTFGLTSSEANKLNKALSKESGISGYSNTPYLSKSKALSSVSSILPSNNEMSYSIKSSSSKSLDSISRPAMFSPSYKINPMSNQKYSSQSSESPNFNSPSYNILGYSKKTEFPKYPTRYKSYNPIRYPPANYILNSPNIPNRTPRNKPSSKGKFKKDNKLLKISSPTKYQPSLSATVLKITSKRIPKTLGGRKSYFAGFRPMILKLGKRRKKQQERNERFKNSLSII